MPTKTNVNTHVGDYVCNVDKEYKEKRKFLCENSNSILANLKTNLNNLENCFTTTEHIQCNTEDINKEKAIFSFWVCQHGILSIYWKIFSIKPWKTNSDEFRNIWNFKCDWIREWKNLDVCKISLRTKSRDTYPSWFLSKTLNTFWIFWWSLDLLTLFVVTNYSWNCSEQALARSWQRN